MKTIKQLVEDYANEIAEDICQGGYKIDPKMSNDLRRHFLIQIRKLIINNYQIEGAEL